MGGGGALSSLNVTLALIAGVDRVSGADTRAITKDQALEHGDFARSPVRAEAGTTISIRRSRLPGSLDMIARMLEAVEVSPTALGRPTRQ
nr:hypothetical protein GCM10017606_24760 [Microbacterium terregens]